MRFAIIDDKLTEAKPELAGLCPGCNQSVISKCGTQRIHHWAHRNNKACDGWWESETEWHRSWKNNFPIEWQEIFLPDAQSGEKHIADVRTSDGLVIEFQHSHIAPQERTTREKFYQNMIWVADGTRLKRDYPRFLKGKEHFRSAGKGIFLIDFVEECFPSAWIGSSVPVIFDFQGNEPIDDLSDTRNDLYLLFPGQIGRDAIIAVMSRKAFVDAAIAGKLLLWVRNYISRITQINQKWEVQMARQQRLQDNINFQRFSRVIQYRKYRRF